MPPGWCGDLFVMLVGGAAVFGGVGKVGCGAEGSGFEDPGTLGGGAVGGVDGSGPSSAFALALAGQVYTVMVDAGGLSVVVVVCMVAVEVVVYVMTMVMGSELVFEAAFGVVGVPRTLESVGRVGEVVWTGGALGI